MKAALIVTLFEAFSAHAMANNLVIQNHSNELLVITTYEKCPGKVEVKNVSCVFPYTVAYFDDYSSGHSYIVQSEVKKDACDSQTLKKKSIEFKMTDGTATAVIEKTGDMSFKSE